MKKLHILTIVFIAMASINVYANDNDDFTKNGWVVEHNRTYYYENNDKVTGFHEIEQNDYYFNEYGELQKGGVREIDGKMYFLGINTGKIMKGWFNDYEGRTFHSDPDTGELSHLWTELDGKMYFFEIKTYKLMKGILTLEDGVYYLDKTTGERKTGMIQEGNNTYYFSQEDGKKIGGRYTINGYEYYFNENGELQKGGVREIDGKMYFLGINTGKIMKGWFNDYEGRTFHSDPDTGELSHLWTEIDGKTYFFGIKTYKLIKGILTLEDGIYYLNTKTGEKEAGKKKIGNNEYYFNEETYLLEKVQYIPVYYNQKDSRWVNKKYGFSTLGKTGCASTSMAMAFESILDRRVLPPEVADFLYYQTSEYNKYTTGSSGLAIIRATDYFNIKRTGISSLEQLNQELEKGKIVFAAMGNGKFATTSWNHAIILFNHSYDNKTVAYDPLKESNNGWIETSKIWNEKSTDSDDIRGGFIFYALERN